MNPCRIVCVIFFIMLFIMNTSADTGSSGPVAGESTGSKSSKLKIKVDIGSEFEYSDNIYHLTESQKSNLEELDQEDVDNGRYNDMDDVRDVIITPRLKFNVDLPSPLGGKVDFTSWIYYHVYTKNTASSYPEFRAGLKHAIGKKGDINLKLSYVNDFFRKNYLSEIEDINENGNISKEERIYSPAVYDAFEGIIAYDYNVLKEKNNRISRVDIEPFGGWGHREYNSEFSNRDKQITFGGLAIHIKLLTRLALKTVYEYQYVESPGNYELVLFDETIGENDVNQDGEIKENAAIVTRIDRSCERHSLEIIPSIDLTDNCSVFLGYKCRTSTYDSDNPLDIDYYGQTAVREQMEAGMTYDLSKKWTAEASFSRTDDDSEEEDDYTENRVIFVIKYDLN